MCAHPCPFDWNIEFSKTIEIHGATMADFANQLNVAVDKETKGRVKMAFLFQCIPDSFTKVPEKSPFARQMDTLIQRYAEVTAPFIAKGVNEYGTVSVSKEFIANFPIACILARPSSPESDYKETKDGAILTLHHDFQCRAYKISATFLETVKEWQREARIPEGVQPVPYLFAILSGMRKEFVTLPDPAKDIVVDSIIDGVTLYIPEESVVLAIEGKSKHEEMTKTMTDRGFLAVPDQDVSGVNTQDAQQAVPSDGHKPSSRASSPGSTAPADEH